MLVAELSQRLNVPYRHVRYVLEEAILPEGVEAEPGKGEHRDLNPTQCFWLAIVLKLKHVGIKTQLAGEIANMIREGMYGMIQLNWEYTFHPFLGKLATENLWYVEIGDMEYFRIATSSYPSKPGLHYLDWTTIAKRNNAKNAKPLVVIQIDLAGIARLLI